MTNHFRNGSGYADPTAAKVIDKELRRDRDRRVTIKKVKNLLNENDYELVERIKIRDKRTGKVYK